jgi:hypothetical protein
MMGRVLGVMLAASVGVVALSGPAAGMPASTMPIVMTRRPEERAAGPGFEGGVFRIGPFLRERLNGRNWHPGCPVPIDDLRHVQVRYWDFEGRARSGPLIVHEMLARDVLGVFQRLFRAGFRIHRIKLPPAYRPSGPGDYWHSTVNRTAAFNCRPATGNPGSLSHHSYGWAIDINPLQNPYVAPDGSVLRRAADRTSTARAASPA